MAKSHNQKGKILFLEQMLRETGENRVVTMQEILTKLMEYGIRAERKSIYDDIEALRDFGMDVKYKRGRPGGYYLAGQTVPGKENILKKAEEQKAEEQKAEEMPKQADIPKEPRHVWVKSGAAGEKKQMKLLCDNKKNRKLRRILVSTRSIKKKPLDILQ